MATRAHGLALVVACLITLGGCDGRGASEDRPTPGSPTSGASPTRLPAIPKLSDDFPLAAGWPDRLRSPQRVSLVLPGCGDGSGLPPNPNGNDRLSVHWSSVGRDRQLTTYDGAPEAAAVARRLVGFYRRCPVVVSRELPWRTLTSVRPAATGEESWLVVQSTEIEGRLAGATALLVVRVGRAVLVDHIGFAYPARTGPAGTAARLDRELEEQAHRVVSVVGAMCTLRERGC